MNKKYCITFAGVLGSSKSPIANFLSYNLDLPIFSNDMIRKEVVEDVGKYDQTEYLSRRDERLKVLLERGMPFIFDASVDRSWEEFSKNINNYGYECFVISLDISRQYIEKLYAAKGYEEDIDLYESQHESFLNVYSDMVNLHITDETFDDRLALSLATVKTWLED